jgi:hypothetical protein
MNHSESVKNLLPALASAIAAMPDPKKNAKNDHFRNRYADLGSVLECCFEPLASNGLVLTQTVSGQALVTRLWHVASGEWIDSIFALQPEKNTPQGFASALTYARRYSIKALFGMVDTDDDGNVASGQVPFKPAAKSTSAAANSVEKAVGGSVLSGMEISGLMRDAVSLDALDKLAATAKELPDSEKQEVREVYRAMKQKIDSK